MEDITAFLSTYFEEEYCSRDVEERKEFLSQCLNEGNECVLYEFVWRWIEETLDIIIPEASLRFKNVILNSININEFRDGIFQFLINEDPELITS